MLQENDELIFEDLPLFQEDKILEDLLAEYAAVLLSNGNDASVQVQEEGKGNDTSDGAKKRKRTKSSVNVSDHDRVININDENKTAGNVSKDTKKVMHREVERQRRQEMAGLYASLRSLLPLEYIKGKRAVSDHMDEAVKFIKHMQAKTKAMRMQRDKMKKLFTLSGGVINDERSSIVSDSSNCVKVNVLGGEVEILISGDEGLPLSKVLLDLQQKGLNVINCLSNRVNEQSLHKIQVQATNLTCEDISELQQRLAYVIKQA